MRSQNQQNEIFLIFQWNGKWQHQKVEKCKENIADTFDTFNEGYPFFAYDIGYTINSDRESIWHTQL